MRITKLVLTNWMAFRGRQELDLPALPIAIVGRYADNGRRSNWAGKTALLEAIGYALHGEHRKRLEDGIIHYGMSEASVSVTLDTGDVITRTRPRGGPTKVMVTKFDNTGAVALEGAAAEERVGRLLGMSAEDLAATVVFAQGDTEALVGMRSGERRKIVGRWLELERWERAGDAARKRLKDATSRLDVLQSLSPPTAAMTREQIAAEREELEGIEADSAELELAGDDAATKLRALNAGDVSDELARVVENGKRARARLTELGQHGPLGELEQLRAEETRLAVELAEADKRSKELGDIIEHGFDGVCPVMGEACPADKLVGATVEQHAHLVEEARANRTRLFGLHRSARDAVAAAGRRMQDRAEAKAAYDAATTRYKELRAKADERAVRLAEVDVKALQDAVAAGREAGARRTEARGRLTFLAHVERDIERREKEDERRRAELGTLAREVKILAAVTKALGSTGISQRIAASQLVALEERANAMLAGSGLSFVFGWERETKDPAPLCLECGHVFKGKSMKPCPSCEAPRGLKRSDELEILVDDGSGEVEDVRAKSGGARVLVASAIRLAGGAMLRELKGSRVAWSIVDEPFGPLDAENREALARTFAGMLGSVGLEQAFVVSHDAALLEALPARIVVRRENDASIATVEA